VAAAIGQVRPPPTKSKFITVILFSFPSFSSFSFFPSSLFQVEDETATGFPFVEKPNLGTVYQVLGCSSKIEILDQPQHYGYFVGLARRRLTEYSCTVNARGHSGERDDGDALAAYSTSALCSSHADLQRNTHSW
jgi:hypothetical protein